MSPVIKGDAVPKCAGVLAHTGAVFCSTGTQTRLWLLSAYLCF